MTADDRTTSADQARSETEPKPTAGDGGPAAAGTAQPLAQRPEVLVGAAFGGAFIVARVLKRLFD